MFSEQHLALALWPALFVFLCVLPCLQQQDPLTRRLMCAFVMATNVCYLLWRWRTVTAEGVLVMPWVVWTYFIIEAAAIAQAMGFWICMSRAVSTPDDTPRAAKAWPPAGQWPSVEVWIPTYQEPLAVLEKAILAACCIDYPHLKVRVLDDGSRDWLRRWCEARGVEHVTRPEHRHAKAGNLNHALASSQADFVVVMDADFAAHRDFVQQVLPLFADGRVAIVQTPQTFYNPDLAQQNLGLGGRIADEQALFFRDLQPGRDAFDAAFYCGSCAMLRVAALRDIGGIPTGSLTEDMLTSLVMLARGWKTRYLNRPLSVGLAAESIDGFFLQRDRWSRGALEILFHPCGPLRHPSMTLMQRVLFLPTYWIVNPILHLALILLPAICLFTDASMLGPGQRPDSVLLVVAMVLINLGVLTWMAQGRFSPIISTALGMVMATRLIRSVFVGLCRLGDSRFRITPKGEQARASVDRPVLLFFVGISVATLVGMVYGVKMKPQAGHFGPVDLWVLSLAAFNLLHLLIAMRLVEDRPRRRTEERFAIGRSLPFRAGGVNQHVFVIDMSANGVRFLLPASRPDGTELSCALQVSGHWLPLQVQRRRALAGAEDEVAAAFNNRETGARTALIQFLFCGAFVPVVQGKSRMWGALARAARAVLRSRPSRN